MFPDSRLTGRANLLVMPNLDAANTAYNLTRVMTDGVGIGPMLMGMAKPAHVLTTSATVRRVVNMTAIAAVEAQIRAALGRLTRAAPSAAFIEFVRSAGQSGFVLWPYSQQPDTFRYMHGGVAQSAYWSLTRHLRMASCTCVPISGGHACWPPLRLILRAGATGAARTAQPWNGTVTTVLGYVLSALPAAAAVDRARPAPACGAGTKAPGQGSARRAVRA